MMMTKLFSGRLNRLQFIVGMLYYLGAAMLAIIFAAFIFSFFVAGQSEPITRSDVNPMVGFAVILYIFILFGCISLAIRRLHDLNRSGHFLWWGLLPGVALVMVIYLLLAPSVAAENDYGRSDGSLDFWRVTGWR